ncbi:P-loop containing nucleoside triphosphate hydrolase protein [Haematococcus lacustris]
MEPASQELVPTTVRIRLRPRNAREQGGSCITLDRHGGAVGFTGTDNVETAFTFDQAYGETATQAEVFNDLAFVVDAALAGYNGAVLAYGQTGSGKTHTLFGSMADETARGVVPRSIAHLGQGIAGAAAQHGALFKVTLSVVEIYCERIRCLLDSAGRDNLQVKTDPVRGVYVDGATEVEVCGEDELATLMAAGLSGRSVAATAMNSESSRSHCVVTVNVERSMPSGEARLGKLVLVDLAGSERASKTGAAGSTLAEGALINKSLSCLANVIYALTDASAAARHVPYRDSKLTRMLQDSLGGTARTVLICCCSPAMDNAAETLSTLRFGARAKGLTCKLQVNQRLSAERLQQLLKAEKSTREALAAEVAHLKTLLAAAGVEYSPAPQGAETTAPSGAEPEGAPTGVAERAEEPGKDGDGDEGSPPASSGLVTIVPGSGSRLAVQLLDGLALATLLASVFGFLAWEDWRRSTLLL